MNKVLIKLEETANYLKSQTKLKPRVGMVLGSGFGSFAKAIQVETQVSYADIPNFLPTSIEGHFGVLTFGTIGKIPVAVLQGRVHYYEGHTMDEVVFPTRVLSMMGIDTLLLTNAAGGLNPNMKPGDFMVISDHINLMGDNPLKGPNLQNLGPRFPDMSEAYDKSIRRDLLAVMGKTNVGVHEGVYCAVSGPTYETPAEVRYLKKIGTDAVGMSTVPETIAANHLGIRVGAISCITNLASGISKTKLSHDEVTETAQKVEGQFSTFMKEFFDLL